MKKILAFLSLLALSSSHPSTSLSNSKLRPRPSPSKPPSYPANFFADNEQYSSQNFNSPLQTITRNHPSAPLSPFQIKNQQKPQGKFLGNSIYGSRQTMKQETTGKSKGKGRKHGTKPDRPNPKPPTLKFGWRPPHKIPKENQKK